CVLIGVVGLGGGDVRGGAEVDVIAEQVDQRYFGDLVRSRVEGIVGVVGREVDHAYGADFVARHGGTAELPQQQRHAVAAREAGGESGDRNEETLAYEFAADAAAAFAVGGGRRQRDDRAPAGRCVK